MNSASPPCHPLGWPNHSSSCSERVRLLGSTQKGSTPQRPSWIAKDWFRNGTHGLLVFRTSDPLSRPSTATIGSRSVDLCWKGTFQAWCYSQSTSAQYRVVLLTHTHSSSSLRQTFDRRLRAGLHRRNELRIKASQSADSLCGKSFEVQLCPNRFVWCVSATDLSIAARGASYAILLVEVSRCILRHHRLNQCWSRTTRRHSLSCPAFLWQFWILGRDVYKHKCLVVWKRGTKGSNWPEDSFLSLLSILHRRCRWFRRHLTWKDFECCERVGK